MIVKTEMVKTERNNRVLEVANLRSRAVPEAVEAPVESLGAPLQRGDRVVLRRFGVFNAARRSPGSARNPRTGAPMCIPRGRMVRFPPRQCLPTVLGGRNDGRRGKTSNRERRSNVVSISR